VQGAETAAELTTAGSPIPLDGGAAYVYYIDEQIDDWQAFITHSFSDFP
jgi:hypothetical protein